MQSFSLLAFLAFVLISSSASPAKAAPKSALKKAEIFHPLPALLQEAEAKYTRVPTVRAEFHQINEAPATHSKKESFGVLMFKRPDKLRWETLKPDPNLLISDGKRFWFYTPPFDPSEPGQVMERKSSEVQSQIAHALLSGTFSILRGMPMKELSPALFEFTLKPGSASTVEKATVGVDPATKLVQKVILVHKGGNRSEITLSQIELGQDLSDESFVFKAPPNTEHLKD